MRSGGAPCRRSSVALSAGVSVSETNRDRKVETAIVTANWR